MVRIMRSRTRKPHKSCRGRLSPTWRIRYRPLGTDRLPKDGQLAAGILKLTVSDVMTERQLDEYAMYANSIAYHIYQPDTTSDLIRRSPEIQVAPRSTRLEVCCAQFPRVTTAFGPAGQGDFPLQLWVVWPSTELHRLTTCYGDTNAALLR